MGTRRFWMWVGAIVLTLAGAASIARSSGNEGRAVNADQRFIRVGDYYYINASRIDYMVREPDGLLVVFGSEAETRLKLTGPAAQEMQRWLEGAPVVRERPRPGAYSQQGPISPQMNPQGNPAPQTNPQGNPGPRNGPQGRGAPGPASGSIFRRSQEDRPPSGQGVPG